MSESDQRVVKPGRPRRAGQVVRLDVRVSQEAFDMAGELAQKHFPTLVRSYGSIVDLAIRRMYEEEQKERES